MRRRLVAALCCLCAAGCGDNVGGEESGFRILRVTPGNGTVGVDVESAVVVELSEPVDPDSVDGDAVELTGVEASVDVAGAAITLTPHARLPFDSELELTVTTAITSAAGEPLPAPLTSRFHTRWRMWSEPEMIGPASDQTGVSPFRPLVVGAPTGDAVAVWEDDATGAYRLSGARYAAADRSWTEDEEIASGGAEHTLAPQLAADAAGNTLLVWRSAERIEHAWYNADNSAWYHGPPVHIGEAVVSVPVVALSPGGKGAALWSEPGVGRMVARLDGDAWSPAEVLGAGKADGAALAVDDDGVITIVWKNRSGLQAQRSDDGGWGERVPLWTDGEAGTADRVRVAAMPGGAAVAVWGVVLDDGAEVHARFFDPGPGAWSIDEVIATADGAGATMPEVAVSAAGDVLVVWGEWNGGLDARWWRGGWEDPVTVAGGDVHAPEHQLALDGDGNAVTAYAMVSAATWWTDRGWAAGAVAPNALTVPIAVTFAGPDPLAVWEQYTADGRQQGMRASFFR